MTTNAKKSIKYSALSLILRITVLSYISLALFVVSCLHHVFSACEKGVDECIRVTIYVEGV